MNELTELVSKKTGIPKAQAELAVKTVIDFLKTKLPAPLAGQIDNVLSGDMKAGALEGITKGLGGILGKK